MLESAGCARAAQNLTRIRLAPIRHTMTEPTSAHPRKPLCLIAAMDADGAIGLGNDIPWRIPGEQKRFKELTLGNALIMGRLTYDSIGRPLPGRKTIILTRAAGFVVEGAAVAHSTEEAMALANDYGGNRICVGGGTEIYQLFLAQADQLFLTRIHHAYGGDRFFPAVDPALFALTVSCDVDGPVPYTNETYMRRKAVAPAPV